MTRRLILRTMLVALAASAAIGVVSIFTMGTLEGRLAGTALALSLTTLLMLPFTPREGGGRPTMLQRVVLAYIAVGFVLALALIWDVRLPMSIGARYPLAPWLAVGLPALVVAAPALGSRGREDRSLALAESIAIRGAAAALAATFVAFALNSTIGLAVDDGYKIGFCVLGAVVAAATAAIGVRGPSTAPIAPRPGTDRLDRAVGWIGIAAACGWLVLAIVAVYDDAVAMAAARFQGGPWPLPSGLWSIASAHGGSALAAGIWCALGLSRVRSPLRFLRHATAATTLALAILTTYSVHKYSQGAFPQSIVGQLIAALAIVDFAALVGSLVLMRLHRGRRIESAPIEAFDWNCPRCGTRATIGPGEHVCAACALAVRIEFRDDRCPACGYDLRGLPPGAHACSECGRERQMPATAAG
jgi:hypothetical protein